MTMKNLFRMNMSDQVGHFIGIPGTEKYYYEQHKLDDNKLINKIRITVDYNVKKLNSKLFQNCLKIFVSYLILFVVSFKYLL